MISGGWVGGGEPPHLATAAGDRPFAASSTAVGKILHPFQLKVAARHFSEDC